MTNGSRRCMADTASCRGALRRLLLSFCLLSSAFCFLPSSAFCLPPASPSPAPATNNGRPAYDSFRLIHTRNVFDPDRRPIRPPGSAASSAAPTHADYVALTGIASDGEKSLAFFSGSPRGFQ